MSRKIIDEQFFVIFLESLDYPDSDTTKKINGFSPQYSFTSGMFQTEFMMEEFELVVPEESLKDSL